MKTIGKSVRIGHIDFKINYVTHIDPGMRGEMDPIAAEISIRQMAPEVEYATLWHEIVHATLDNAGLYEHCQDEGLVSALAEGVTGVLKDNVWVRNYYNKETK